MLCSNMLDGVPLLGTPQCETLLLHQEELREDEYSESRAEELALSVSRDVMGDIGSTVNNGIITLYSDRRLLDLSHWSLYKYRDVKSQRCAPEMKIIIYINYTLIFLMVFYGATMSVSEKCWALDGVAQWVEHWPANQKVAGLIPGQGTCLGCRPGPQWGGGCERQLINVSLTLMFFSFFFPPPFSSL